MDTNLLVNIAKATKEEPTKIPTLIGIGALVILGLAAMSAVRIVYYFYLLATYAPRIAF